MHDRCDVKRPALADRHAVRAQSRAPVRGRLFVDMGRVGLKTAVRADGSRVGRGDDGVAARCNARADRIYERSALNVLHDLDRSYDVKQAEFVAVFTNV